MRHVSCLVQQHLTLLLSLDGMAWQVDPDVSSLSWSSSGPLRVQFQPPNSVPVAGYVHVQLSLPQVVPPTNTKPRLLDALTACRSALSLFDYTTEN